MSFSKGHSVSHSSYHHQHQLCFILCHPFFLSFFYILFSHHFFSSFILILSSYHFFVFLSFILVSYHSILPFFQLFLIVFSPFSYLFLIFFLSFSYLFLTFFLSFFLIFFSSLFFCFFSVSQEDGEGTMSVECVGFSKGAFRWAASGGLDKTLKVRRKKL